ncbi:MAG: DUF2808 domain-containing protein [Oculatellaceae cyanobacterium bins.114]|nr:DUF2808 domain-containing protein [Oculatellaceae cyanobacterium bins.114]
MTQFSNLSHLLLKTLISGSFLLLSFPAIAAQLSNGQQVFDRAPRVVRVVSNSAQVNQSGDTYRLVISVPEDAGAPLQAIRITQRADQEAIAFQPNETRIFAMNPRTEISQMNLGGTEPEPGEVMVVLEQPVQPGQTVTLYLKPERNPSQDGIYSLGVTAYPVGEDSPGLFLGYSRLNFYAPNGR